MLKRVEKAQQKWGGSHTVIDNWLNERQELIVLYCKIAGFSPYEKKDQSLPEPSQIQTFCQILMDYLLPHIGETNFKNKAFYIGHMVKQLLLYLITSLIYLFVTINMKLKIVKLLNYKN